MSMKGPPKQTQAQIDAQKAAERVIPMPIEDDEATRLARRKEIARVAGLTGRESTILSGAGRTGDPARPMTRGSFASAMLPPRAATPPPANATYG